MNRTVLRRIAAPGVAALTLGLALSACGAGNEGNSTSSSSLSGTLKGAGSSAQDSAMKAWRAGFQTDNSKVTVNYDPSGSGAGVTQFNAGAIDFAGSDAALDPAAGEVDAAKQRCGGVNALEVPDYVSPIAVAFNVDGVDKLNLSAKTVSDIFDGKISKWDDPAIKADNPDAKLPDTKISPVHRSDESGTTKNFTDYLSKAGEGAWTYPADKVWPIKSGEAANQTSGMIAAIKAGAGSIGYADESQVGDLSVASIKVGDAFVAPSAEGAAKALEVSPLDDTRTEGDLAVKVDRTTTEAGAYPLMLTSYLIACPTYSGDKADLVKAFLKYVVSTDGQKEAADNAGSAPLPATLQSKAEEIINTISAK
ncbi:phosphate transport system substrate-binding protein [Marmoricola sp. URHA0025 HA25]